MEKKEELIDELLIRYLENNVTEEEQRQAEEWIRANKQNTRYFLELKDVYEATVLGKSGAKFDASKSWEKIKARYLLNNKKNKDLRNSKTTIVYSIYKLARIAAILIIAFVLGMLVTRKQENKKVVALYNEVSAPLGSKTKLILTDGTRVWLNAGSTLKYPANFYGNTRDVYLEGEGYFEVTKDKKHKFIVHTSHLNVNVLGTEFNVKAYPNEKAIETTLVSGLVTIENSETNPEKFKPIHLEKNQMAKFIKEKSQFEVTKEKEQPAKTAPVQTKEQPLTIIQGINPVVYTSWKDTRWVIMGETLESLAIKLERRYDVSISFADRELKKYKVTGTLADETLEQVLNVIKLIAPIHYKIENKKVQFFTNRSFKENYDKMLINAK